MFLLNFQSYLALWEAKKELAFPKLSQNPVSKEGYSEVQHLDWRTPPSVSKLKLMAAH